MCDSLLLGIWVYIDTRAGIIAAPLTDGCVHFHHLHVLVDLEGRCQLSLAAESVAVIIFRAAGNDRS